MMGQQKRDGIAVAAENKREEKKQERKRLKEGKKAA
jgi:hypothetical protein